MLNAQNADAQLGAGQCLPDLMAAALAERPYGTAVRCAGRDLTYRELAGRSDRLARGLLRAGTGRGDLVGIALTPSLDLVVAVLGVMKAGAAYVAVDPAYPAKRIGFILADSGARSAIVDASAEPVAAMLTGSPYTVEDLVAAGDPAHPAEPLPPGDPDSLCYLIYTSGSTGRPKGAMNRHAGVVHTMLGLAGAVGLERTDRVLQASSLNFDLSVIEIFTSLLSGATLVVPTAAERTDPGALLDLLARERVTVWSSTPALLRPVTDTAARRGEGLPATLRTVVLAGDRFPPAMVATLHELGAGIRAFNVAGVTEVSCCSTVYEVRKEDAARDAVPWGRALPGHLLYVLDERRRPVPPGEPGELYLGGVAVGAGYWNRPDLTGERYLPDPFQDAGAMMYKTGDLVRHPAGADLEFLGRLDNQIKVRGLRVELGELESVLEQHPDIQQAVVVAREARVGESALVGYVVPMPGRLLTARQCRDHLAGSVPRHSVPSQFHLLSGLPLLPNGKIDRNALPVPADEPEHAPADDGAPAPAGLLPAVLAIWREVLGTGRVGRHDEFFELGGTSLHAMEIVARVREGLGLPTRLADLLDHPTPAGYAAHLGAAPVPGR